MTEEQRKTPSAEAGNLSDEGQGALPGFEPNPERYRKLSLPFANADEANEAVRAFGEAVSALRVEHRMPDFIGVAAGTYLDPSGEESDFVIPLQFGNAMKAEGMAAWMYGRLAADRETLMAAMMKSGKKGARAR